MKAYRAHPANPLDPFLSKLAVSKQMRRSGINPLRKGYSRRTISGNIARETRAGYPPKRAQAMAYRSARASFARRHPGKRLPAEIARVNPKFKRSQIQELRRQFGNIETAGVEWLPKFRAILGKMDDEMLEQVAHANIKFLSKLAVNEQTRRSGINPRGAAVHLDIDVNSHNATGRAKNRFRGNARGALNEGEAMTAYATNAKRHIKVECERGGAWHTVALFPLSAEGKREAKRFGKQYARRHRVKLRATY